MPAVVFLHAFPLTSRMWRPQREALPPGWTPILPDFRGFGDAPPDDPSGPPRSVATLEDYADDVVALLDDRRVGPAVFCGCSMGGYTALAALRKYPDRVAGLILADTRATGDSEQGRSGRLAMIEHLDREGPSAVAAQMLPKLVGPTTRAVRPEVVAAVEDMASRATAAGIGYAVTRMLNRPDSTGVLSAFRGPVLLIVGAEDELTPVAESEAMAAAAPGASLVVIPRAGHLANLESPDAFNAALVTFLTARCAPSRESRTQGPGTRSTP